MKLKVNTVVIDDIPLYAEIVEEALRERNEISSVAEYVITVFSKSSHFSDAKKFIQEHILSNKPIDLIFSDFHLKGGGTGIDLFNLFNDSPQKPFRMLHSNTDERLSEHTGDFSRNFFDDFSKTKNREAVLNKLEQYEKEILIVKSHGNPLLYKKYYINGSFRPTEAAGRTNGEFNLLDILCIESEDDRSYITFRVHNENSVRVGYTDHGITGDYRQDDFLRLAKGLEFVRLNQSQTVNLLWVSKIDIQSKIVHFITPDSEKYELKIHNFSTRYNSPSIDFIANLPKKLPRFFH